MVFDRGILESIKPLAGFSHVVKKGSDVTQVESAQGEEPTFHETPTNVNAYAICGNICPRIFHLLGEDGARLAT